ncbi:MAG: polymer-forming cytoskeletal protein [Anaerolineaceae bacterium]|nr:polymer-forming cytoskeletal protein [Anaerolineaceae bacterium]
MKAFFHRKIIQGVLFVIITIILLIININTIQAALPSIESNLGPEDEIFDDLYLQGNEVTVAGKVHGMLFVIGEKIVIESSAQIDNDIFLLGRNIQIEQNATLSGNLFVGGQNVVVRAPVDRNLAVASATLELSPNANIGRNLFFAGFHIIQLKVSSIQENLYAGCYQISINGTVEKNLRVSAVSVEINGDVKGNAEVAIDASGDDEGIRIWLPYMQQFKIPDLLPIGLQVGDQARIEGQLIYTSAKSLEENLRNLPIGGVVENISNPETMQKDGKDKVVIKNPFVLRLIRMLRQLVGFLLFAIIGWKYGKRYISEASEYAINKPLNSLGVGFISVLVVNLGALVFFFLIILVSVLLLIFTLNQLGNSLFFLGLAVIVLSLLLFGIIATYISKFVLAYWAGGWVLNKFQYTKENKDVWGLLVGIFLYLILNVIPIFGWILGVLVTLIGLGAIWFTLQKHDQTGILPDFE